MEGYIFTHNLCSGYFPDYIPLDDNTFTKLYSDNENRNTTHISLMAGTLNKSITLIASITMITI